MNRERRKALQAIVDQLETLQMQLEEIQTEEEEYREHPGDGIYDTGLSLIHI